MRRNIEGNFKYKRINVTVVILQAWNLYSYLKAWRASPLKDEERVDFSKWPASWKIILETMTGNVVISVVDALMCVVLSKAKKNTA
jgi:hypothetical protein